MTLSVTLAPDPRSWAASLRAPMPNSPASRARAQAQLPTDRPVVLSGHQAAFWHPGIVAKLIALRAVSAAASAHAAWLDTDQDTADPAILAYPALREGAASVRRVWSVRAAHPQSPTRAPRQPPSSRIPAFTPVPLAAAELARAAPCVRASHDLILAALTEHLCASSAAEQTTRAAFELLSAALPRSAFAAPQRLSVCDLSRLDAFTMFVSAMLHDPRACVTAYNRAASAHPAAGIAPLGITPDDCELPLWRVPPHADAPRRRVFARELAHIPTHELAPRALALTAFVRLFLCDLFIHGTGGGGGGGGGGSEKTRGSRPHPGYEAVTTAWIADWLPRVLAARPDLAPAFPPPSSLAPFVTASATLTLPPDSIAPTHSSLGSPRLLDALMPPASMPSSPSLLSLPAPADAPRPAGITDSSRHSAPRASPASSSSIAHCPLPIASSSLLDAAPLAHRARHDPALLGDASAAAEKARLLAAIASAPRASAARRALYHELHDLLAAARAAAPDRLAAFDAHAVAASASRATLELLADRTFPFPFHSAAALRALAEAILARFPV